ncbi:MAG: S9 family peptidase [Flavipsychrobacter sp.]
MKHLLLPIMLLTSGSLLAQDHMTPELLWSLKRVGAEGISDDGKTLFFSSRKYDWKTETSKSEKYALNIASGQATLLNSGDISVIQRAGKVWYGVDGNKLFRSEDKGADWKELYQLNDGAENVQVSPDGTKVIYSKEVLVKKMMGTDIYPDLPKSTAQVYTDLNYRHWDTWEDGKFSHVFVANMIDGSETDIMQDQPFDCPQKPFGGAEDLMWAPDGKGVVYVTKKKFGKAYAISTNTDIFYYDLATKNTVNWSANMMGFDMSPSFSPDGKRIAWTSMKRDGYEADKNDIIVMDIESQQSFKRNLTSSWDGTVNGFAWSNNGKEIYFTAAHRGTVQLFKIAVPANLMTESLPMVSKITEGKFDVGGIVGQTGKQLIVSRRDMNHASELYAVTLSNGKMEQLTHENDDIYNNLKMSNTELRMMRTSDGGEMGTWVIYPPDFDPKKKYPTLLYCQGGPQSALSQFYSFRWNFQLMAAQGYIVVAPNRHGMPGWGVNWNEAISKDWGGQPMRDYLLAIDEVAKESYVDNERLGCIGASYGGYSVFMLAGMHENRFKSFIAHDGLFDLKSWYGTTEELWFANWDIGGAYWDKPQAESYKRFNPINFVDKWNTPIMIVQGGLDFRVGIEQGLEAFQAAQLQGIKSKLLYFPNENHWVLHAQNGITWHREFFKWLEETVK